LQGGDTVPLVISPTTPRRQDVVVRPCHATIDHLQADKPAFDPFGAFFRQRFAADEVPLIEFDDPPQPRLQGGGFSRNVIAI
jgi:hypothetical protein